MIEDKDVFTKRAAIFFSNPQGPLELENVRRGNKIRVLSSFIIKI